MHRPLIAAAAAALSVSPAAAATYSAQLSVPSTQRIIARNIVWYCGPAACQGTSAESRPAVLCQSLAKRAGRIENFIVDGRALAATELDRCNAVAKPPKPASLADR